MNARREEIFTDDARSRITEQEMTVGEIRRGLFLNFRE